MSRSGYSDECEHVGLWRGAVDRAIRGKRGQAFLLELRAALDAMPEKRLIANTLAKEGEFCAIGTVGAARGVDMSKLDPSDSDAVGAAFGIAPAMAAEIVYMNDEFACHIHRGAESPEERWQRMRAWVGEQLRTQGAA